MNHPEPRFATPRAKAALGLLCAVLLIELAVLASNLLVLTSPGPGYLPYIEQAGRIYIQPTAFASAPGLATPLELLEVNGQALDKLPEGRDRLEQVRRLGRSEAGAVNHLVVRDANQKRASLELRAATPSIFATLFGPALVSVFYHFLGLIYAGIGAAVWWLRPRDKAAFALLAFTVVAFVNMRFALMGSSVAGYVPAINLGVLPFYGPTGCYLAFSMTGVLESRVRRGVVLGWLVLAMLTSSWLVVATLGVRRAIDPWAEYLRLGVSATGVELALAVLVMVWVSWRGALDTARPALRRRARVLAWACLVSFLLPSLRMVVAPYNLVPSTRPFIALDLVLLAMFPLSLGYAIVRHQMFDLRIVLRKGVVYGGLSLVVSLVYVGVSLGLVRLVGQSASSTVFMGLTAAGLVVGFGILKVRVQGAIDRWVFRSRYAYAAAVTDASDRLARARDVDDVVETVKNALIDKLKLERAYLAVRRERDSQTMLCLALGARPDRTYSDKRLPAWLEPEKFLPVRRALSELAPVTAYDNEAATAQANDERELDDEHLTYDDASFWKEFALEVVVPLATGADGERHVVGALLMGPRADGRPFDGEDMELTLLLANQLALALDNAMAFDAIRQLKDGLEAEVVERTRELSQALEELQQAQVQLVESEKQAMLGRLVAGIVHELNTPLGALRSSADTVKLALDKASRALGDERSPAAQRALGSMDIGRDLTGVMRDATERIRELVTGLSNFVNLDEAEDREVDLCKAVDSVLTVLSPSLEGRIQVERDYPETPPLVRCNAPRLNRVFANLLENAIAAIERSGCIRVSVDLVDEAARVRIQDDGRGIAAERLAEVFEFGFTTKQGGRVGLKMGLPSSKRIIEESGGSLSIESGEGSGTTVTIVLPLSPLVEARRSA